MGSRKLFWILVLVGGVAAVAGIIMRRSPNPALHAKAGIIGWGGIALILIARIFLSRRLQKPVTRDRP